MINKTKINTYRHFIIHKPYGYLSQFINNQTRRKNKKLLGELYDFPKGTMAIGRLDETSEGLLLLTTSGKISNHITSNKVEKEYYAQVDGIIAQEAIERLRKGIAINVNSVLYTTKPCQARLLNLVENDFISNRKVRDKRHGPKSWVAITLKEGKFRQVRKMTAAVGHPTLRLIRVRIGKIKLSTNSGVVKEVETFDID